MMRWAARILVLGVVIATVIWAWRVFFPGPERVIRKQLAELAAAATIRPNEAPLAKAAKAQSLTSYFTRDAEVLVNVPGHSERTLSGKDELLEAAMGVRAMLDSLNVEFVDIQVTVAPGKESAAVSLTVKATVSGQKDFLAQELAMAWTKVDRRWLIRRVETIRTLL